jgi:hypothetical protein
VISPNRRKEKIMAEDGLATLKDVRDYFGITGKEMIAEWRKLTDADKRDLRSGLAGDSPTLTY